MRGRAVAAGRPTGFFGVTKLLGFFPSFAEIKLESLEVLYTFAKSEVSAKGRKGSQELRISVSSPSFETRSSSKSWPGQAAKREADLRLVLRVFVHASTAARGFA